MTRINLVDPKILCDQHLLAEHRELTRIPNGVASGRYKLDAIPPDYVLGQGHVKFFLDKMKFLRDRYDSLHEECIRRGFSVTYRWPQDLPNDEDIWKDYIPTRTALDANAARISERMPKKPRFSGS